MESTSFSPSLATLVALAVVAGTTAPLRADPAQYISRGAAWRYFRGLEEASSPDTTTWRRPDFDDAAWKEGAAPFGFGDPPYGTDLSRLDPPMRNNYSSLFLRRSFDLSDVTRVLELELNADYDDGFILWLNGVEILRVNVNGLPGDPVTFDGLAASNREPGEYVNLGLQDAKQHLVAGTNVLAVQAFNYTRINPDFKIDLELFDPLGPDLLPPAIAFTVPGPGASIRRLTQVEITFSEDVLGVDSADLIMAGRPAASVIGAGAGPYTFIFSQPPAGAVDVAWAAGHGITDMSEHPNPFAGGGWMYNLDPGSPPAELVIGEILASSGDGLRDEDGEASDWIEIQNRGKLAVNLSGWALTDDRAEPGKWTFPNVSIGPGEFLVVFASGKDRRPTFGGILHSSFKLSAAGEYLGLFTPESPRQVLHEFAAQFPEQRRDISYGLDASGTKRYLEAPTPGAANGEGLSFSDFAADPEFTPGHGFFAAAVSVEIGTRTPGAAIYYSLDGSEPTPETGTPYTTPIDVAGTPRKGAVVLRAVTYKEGYLPSNSSTATYIFPEHVLTQPADPDGFPRRWGPAPAVDYEMDPEIVNDPAYADALRSGWAQIPSISLVMHVDDMFGARGIYSNPEAQGVPWERPGSAELLFPDGKTGFQINCGIQVQGGASRLPDKSPKHSFRVLFKGDYGPTRLRYRLFPDSAVEELDVLVLRAGFNNSWTHWNGGQRAHAQFTHDQWARDTQLEMGQLSPHGIFVHVFVNGLYWGLYNPVERPNDAFAASYLGGEKEEYDALNAGVAISGNSISWSAMLAAVNANLALDGPYSALQDHLDVAAMADYMILNFYGSNQDWPSHNWYALRKREPGAPFYFISWDAERILEDLPSNRLGVTDPNTPGHIFSRLKLNPEFRLLFADRVQKHFFAGGALTPEAAAGRLTERNGQIDDAVVLESARWGDYRRDVHRWQDPPFELYKRDEHWIREQSRLLTQYFPRRTEIVLNQFRQAGLYPTAAAPVFGQLGGEIAPGFALTMSLPGGEPGAIHYTTGGSDPRVYGSGEASPTAALYTSPLVLNDLTVVKARTLSGAIWSALTEATFKLPSSPDALTVTEIMYNPPGGKDYEFLELKNTGAATLDLSGMRFTNGIEHTFAPYTHLRPGAFIVLVSNEAAFTDLYPAVAPGGVYSGSLDNSGERITLEDSRGGVVLSLEYNDGDFWPIAPDGFGRSLVLAEAQGSLDHPESWRASSVVDGSPGADDPPPSPGGVVVSEVLSREVEPLEDAIELHNRSGEARAIGGWFLSDNREDEDSLRKFRIPEGTVLAPGGHVVFYEYEFNSTPGAGGSFDLAESGGAVYLSAADGGGNLTGYIVGADFDAAPSGVSTGRHATSIGLDFTAMRGRSFGRDDPKSLDEFRDGAGAPNTAPLIGPVVINEISYHPPEGEAEFVELLNLTDAPIALHEEDSGPGWRLDGLLNPEGTDDFELPAGAVIPARGFLLVVSADPTSFRSRNGISDLVPIVGPNGGALDNGGEQLKLLRPDADLPGGGGFITVDRVRYAGRDPWPSAPDGQGPTLERIAAADHANDPINWGASSRSGGTPGAANSASLPPGNRPPIAAFKAEPASGPAPLVVAFDASESRDPDGAISSHDWNFGDGSSGSGKTVVHTFAAPGAYRVTLRVADGVGAIALAAMTIVATRPASGGQIPNDGNQDGKLDLTDVIFVLRYLFQGASGALPCEGGTILDPGNLSLLDADASASLNITDAVYALTYLFLGGPPPVLGTGCVQIAGCPDTCAD